MISCPPSRISTLHKGIGPGPIQTKRSDTALENGQVRGLYRDAEDSLAECPQSWGSWVLGHSSSAGASKLNIIERSMRSSHPGEENAKNYSKRPALRPIGGHVGVVEQH